MLARTTIGILLVAAVVSAAPAAARAGTRTSPVHDATIVGQRPFTSVTNTHGDTTAVWIRRAHGTTSIRSAEWRPRFGWSEQYTVASRSTVGTTGTGAVPTIDDLAVGADGRAHLLWSLVTGTGRTTALLLSARSPGSTWGSPVVVDSAGADHLLQRRDARVAVPTDGTVMVAWSTSDRVPTSSEHSVWEREQGVDGTLGATRSLGVGFSIQVSTEPSGFADVTWEGIEDLGQGSRAVRSWAVRTPAGAWESSHTVDGLSSTPPPVLTRTGALIDVVGVFDFETGLGREVDISGVEARTLGMPWPGISKQLVAQPTEAQSLHGVLNGGGEPSVGDVTFDRRGRLVVVFGYHENQDVARLVGIPALRGQAYVATQRSRGGWDVQVLDAAAETSGAGSAKLRRGADGVMTATWSIGTNSGSCRSLTYESTQSATGSWSPRRLIANVRSDVQDGSCEPAAVTVGRTSVLQSRERGLLRLTRLVRSRHRPEVPFTVSLITPTWAAVQAAGGIRFRCHAAIAGACSVSLVRAIAAATGTRESALACFNGSTTGVVDPRTNHDDVLVSFPKRCGPVDELRGRHPGWTRPTMTLRLRVAFDAMGHAVSSHWIRVTIRH